MKITNEMGLPEAIFKLVSVSPHNKPGRLSATTLLNGIKQIMLTKRHWEELEEDILDRIWAVIGSAFHHVLEHEGENEFVEEAMEFDLDGITVTGRIDNYNMKEGIVTDWKSVSKWKIIYRDFEDWRRQGLIYAWLLKKNGFEVKTCQFIAIIKDHSKREAKRKSDYPKHPIFVYRFDVTDADIAEIEAFIKEKIAEYNKYKDTEDDAIPPCSAKERWEKPSKYAVRKQTNIKATKVFDVLEEAEKMASEKGKEYVVEIRPGESTRCLDYCSCCEFCNYYRDHVAPAVSEEQEAA